MTAAAHDLQVSVIMPTYNGGRFIVQAIESVLNQDFDSWELIVVDDGSTDDTARTVRPYLDRLTYIRQDRVGVSASRNRGLELAQGRFVVFLDSDDLLLENKLGLQTRAFAEIPGIDIVHSGWRIIDAEGNVVSVETPWQQAPYLDLESFLLWKPVFPGALMFRAFTLRQIGGFDVALQQAEDVDLMIRLLRSGSPAVWLQQVTACYRRHGENTIRKGQIQAKCLDLVLDRFYADPDLPRRFRRSEARVRFNSNMWLVWYLFQTGDSGPITSYLNYAQRASRFQPTSPISVMEWQYKLSGFTARAGQDADPTRQLRPFMKQVAKFSAPIWAMTETSLDIWLEIWRHYVRHDQLQGHAGMRRLVDIPVRQWGRALLPGILIDPLLDTRPIETFGEHLQGLGFSKRTRNRVITAGYLTLFTQFLIRRMFRASWRSLLGAIFSGRSFAGFGDWLAGIARPMLLHTPVYFYRWLKAAINGA